MNAERYFQLVSDRLMDEDPDRRGILDFSLVPQDLVQSVAHVALSNKFWAGTKMSVALETDVDDQGRVVSISMVSALSTTTHLLCDDKWYTIYRIPNWLNVLDYETKQAVPIEEHEAVLIFAGMHPGFDADGNPSC